MTVIDEADVKLFSENGIQVLVVAPDDKLLLFVRSMRREEFEPEPDPMQLRFDRAVYRFTGSVRDDGTRVFEWVRNG